MVVSILLLSAFVSYVSYMLLRPFLQERAFKLNYRNRPVAGAGGLVIIMALLIMTAIFSLQASARLGNSAVLGGSLVFLLLIFAVGLLGLVDDLIGDKQDSGLRGHFRRLKEGRLTSGALKAVGGFSIAIVAASFYSPTIVILLLNALLLALSINTFNLLDLRPGRSIKIFLVAGLVLLIATFRDPVWTLWAFVLPPVLILFWSDLTERSMIGDTGSNILGAVFGYTLIVSLNWYVNLGILIILAAFHYYTENHSLTELIMRVRILRRLDELGMRRRL